MKIRVAKKDDFVEIKKLFHQVHNAHYRNRPDIYMNNDVFSSDEFENILNSKNDNIIVYDDAGIKGFCNYTIKYQKETNYIYGRKYLYVETIVVDEEYKRKGIGEKLYFEIKKIALENDCKSIDLNVWNFNKDAIKFYEKIGLKTKTIKFEEILFK